VTVLSLFPAKWKCKVKWRAETRPQKGRQLETIKLDFLTRAGATADKGTQVNCHRQIQERSHVRFDSFPDNPE